MSRDASTGCKQMEVLITVAVVVGFVGGVIVLAMRAAKADADRATRRRGR